MSRPVPAAAPDYEIGPGTVLMQRTSSPPGTAFVPLGEVSPQAFLDALDDLFIEDILAMTGDELRAAIIADGGDPDAIEAECRAALERAIRECEAARVAKKAPAGTGLPAVASFW